MANRYAQQEPQYGNRNVPQARGVRRPAEEELGHSRERRPQIMEGDRPRGAQIPDAMEVRDQGRANAQPNTAVPRNRGALDVPPGAKNAPMPMNDQDDSMDMYDNGQPSPFDASPAPVPQGRPQAVQPVSQRRQPDYDDAYPAEVPMRDRAMLMNPEPIGPPRTDRYNEYFLSGDGIAREVIQNEICRYLGHDATSRPGKSSDGRSNGYIIRAYRAPTTEMIRSLKEESQRWLTRRNDQSHRQQPMSYEAYRDEHYPVDDVMAVDPPQNRHLHNARNMEELRARAPQQPLPPYTQGMGYGPQYEHAGQPQPHYQALQYDQDPRVYGGLDNRTPPIQPQPMNYRPQDPYQGGYQNARGAPMIIPAAPFPGPRGEELRGPPYQQLPPEPVRRNRP